MPSKSRTFSSLSQSSILKSKTFGKARKRNNNFWEMKITLKRKQQQRGEELRRCQGCSRGFSKLFYGCIINQEALKVSKCEVTAARQPAWLTNKIINKDPTSTRIILNPVTDRQLFLPMTQIVTFLAHSTWINPKFSVIRLKNHAKQLWPPLLPSFHS